MISHSDGINPFLKLFGGKQVEDPCYCATVAVELNINSSGEVNVATKDGLN